MTVERWRIAILVLGVLLTGALIWLASEAHYQSCVDAATARTGAPDNYFSQLAVNNCSRLPF